MTTRKTSGNGKAASPADGTAKSLGLQDGKRIQGIELSAMAPADAVEPGRPTVAHMMGEMVWLLSQSPLHKHFALADLEWMIMPSLMLEQFRVFRDGTRPVGVALWGYLSEEAERKVAAGGVRLRPEEWRSGDSLWLVELIAPFHTAENKMMERMLTDLGRVVLKGKGMRAYIADPCSGARKILHLDEL